MKKKTYSEDSIERFAGLEGIRKKPTPYIGPTNGDGLWTIFREPADNAVDQALAGRNTMVHLIYDKKPNNYWVRDLGEGIPVGKKEFTDERGRVEKLSTFYVVTGLTHGGANFTGDEISRGCFVGETPIELVDGRTLTMLQMYKEYKKGIKNYVWSVCRKTGDLRAQPIEKVHKTGLTRKLVRVHLDTGESFVCTPDHPLYQTSLKKIEASDSLNRSLISADFTLDKDGYRLGSVGGAAKQRLHRVVAEYYGQTVDNRHVHHVDENVVNNEPHNLQSLTPVQHYAEHPEKLSIWMDYLSRSGDEKSALLERRNRRSWYRTLTQQGKALKVACRLLNEGVEITEENFNQFLFHGAPKWDKAIQRFDGISELKILAQSLYDSAKSAAKKELSSGTRFFARLNYLVGYSENSIVNQHSIEMVARRMIGKAVKSLTKTPNKDADADELNSCFSLKAKVSVRSLCQYIDIDEFVSAVRHGIDPYEFVYSDLSDDALITRRNKFDKELAKSKAQTWQTATSSRLANSFLRNLNAMISDGEIISQKNYHERFKNACGNSGWYIGVRACSKVGLRGKHSILTAANSANHKVVRVQKLTLDDEVPVFDLTVPIDHNYRLSCGVFVGNTHGLGIKTTNAMSSFFKVWTFRDNSWWAIEYGSGKIVKDVHKSIAPKMPHGIKATKGTVVCFQPELKLFNKNSEINIDDVRDWCNLTSYLVPGLKVVFTNNKGLTKTLVHERGPIEFIEKRVIELQTILTGKIFTFSSKECDIAVAFSDSEGTELVNAYTNGLKNKDGGEHVRALNDALVKSLLPYKGKLEYTPTDLKEGLLGLVNYKISAPQFNNQPKDKLIDERVYSVAFPQFLSAWADFWLKNKTMAKEVVTRAAELRKKTSDFLKDKKLIKNVKSASRALSTKMADITNNKIPFCERELFVIEGDSAAGCFVHTTKLRLANGTIKTYGELVEDFAKGIDHIGLAYDRTNKKAIPFKYDWPRVTKYTTSLVEVELEDGSKEQCTPEHKWLTSNRGYVQAKDLTPEDDIVVAKVP